MSGFFDVGSSVRRTDERRRRTRPSKEGTDHHGGKSPGTIRQRVVCAEGLDGQRKAKFFGKDTALAKAYAAKLAAKLNGPNRAAMQSRWRRRDGVLPTVAAYLTGRLRSMREAHCKASHRLRLSHCARASHHPGAWHPESSRCQWDRYQATHCRVARPG